MKHLLEWVKYVKIHRRDFDPPRRIKYVKPYNDLVQDKEYETTFKHKSPIDHKWYYHIPELNGAYRTNAFVDISV